jgi:hypothetical protein
MYLPTIIVALESVYATGSVDIGALAEKEVIQ